MNFFDATFEPGGASTPPREASHARQQSLNEEVTEVIGQLGRFWGGFRKQSQEALEVARKDLQGYVSQAQKEISKLGTTPENTEGENASASSSRDIQQPAADDDASSASTSASTSTTLPAEEHPQTPASASLFSRLQSSIPPDLLSSVQRTIPETLETLRHAPERVDLSQLRTTLQRVHIQDATARGEELLRGAGDFLREAVRVVPPSEAGPSSSGVMWDGMDIWTMPLSGVDTPRSESGGSNGKARESGTGTPRRSGEGKAIATRKEALLRAVRTNPEILRVDPAGEKTSEELYKTWVEKEVADKEGGIGGEYWKERVEKELEEDGEPLKVTRDTLVPSDMTEDDFWTRYFFRIHQIEQEEERRKALLQGSIQQDEDFSWEDDDEEATSPTGTLRTQPPTAPAASTPQVGGSLAPTSHPATPGSSSPPPSSEDSYDVVSSGQVSETKGVQGKQDSDESGESDWE
ncbi:hypothetical protein DENSPDRAFT_840896 [Dentipellis sp. KUC8613]|nr:hypothetical protein DENSPDRAFT_840896 [Dentipellis sp. KUC8613]